MSKKYELTSTTKRNRFNKPLYQIRALRDIPEAIVYSDLPGEGGVSPHITTKVIVGGYIGSENNLSQYGDAWIHEDFIAFGNTRVY